MAWCELDDMDDRFCEHGERQQAERAERRQRVATALLQVSPRGMAHFVGCHHKGDDPDMSQWGEVSTPGAWTGLGNGEQYPSTGGFRRDLVATSRCSDCVDHDGPWI
ncbi:hypothetical protein DEI93_02155 [Curtobacterium sp. MCBD17_035]|uniref:hypothetical protein n=1 Tax=Curtobacterium sp. MCBD17_035 TaxID=2175673 RepID=UPI0011B47648|nr:hypothetical protein [Curtobacterium sp. MCBD17_035]WIB67867.1 hypothetical protein DEI93_02155 [Curtobacterium sp. MCBD17_035]